MSEFSNTVYLIIIDIVGGINSRVDEGQDKGQVPKGGHAIGRVTIFTALGLRQKYHWLLLFLLLFPIRVKIKKYQNDFVQ